MGKKRANGECSIRKWKDGWWEGVYTAFYDPATGKQKIKNVLGKTQAEVKEKLKKAIVDSQRLDMNRSGTHTVKSWVQMWYEVYAEPRLRENTKDYYLNYINNHIIPQLGDKAHHDPDPEVLQRSPEERAGAAVPAHPAEEQGTERPGGPRYPYFAE